VSNWFLILIWLCVWNREGAVQRFQSANPYQTFLSHRANIIGDPRERGMTLVQNCNMGFESQSPIILIPPSLAPVE
jgi:hypothetical protein